MVYHVINRGVGKQQLFFNDEDYLAFERIIAETLERRAKRVLSIKSDALLANQVFEASAHLLASRAGVDLIPRM